EETTEEVPAEVEPATENETATVAADNVEEATLSSADEPEKESFWGKIWMAIAWGFVALLTPCVFPMVPVTVSFFMKGGENKATARFRAIAYGLFIITLYTLPILIIVLVTMLFGGNDGVAGVFNWFATHWAPNLVFFIVFMIFAASFFGAFEITLPSSMVNKSDSKADKGGLVGVFFMALTLVLVSFSCTGPIVGTVLVEAAQGSTAWWEPVLIMMAFSTIFAIPFTLLAFAPSLMTKLKSGSWLNAVKVSLGFVEVALGFKFLMVIDQSYGLNIFSRELYIAIWVACGLLWAVYLLGGFKTKHDSDVKYIGPMRLTFAIIVLVFTLWMVPGMWGAPLKPLSGYMPPISAQNYKVASADDLKNISVVGGGESTGHGEFINPLTGKAPLFSDMDGIHAPGGFTAFFDYEEAMEYAKHVGKPLFIDVTGIACVNCREMEQNVWTDPTVARILREDYVMVCIFMDVKQDLPEKYWVVDDKGKTRKQMGKINTAWSLKNFNQVAQPLYVLMDPRDGKQLGPTRAYDKSVPAYIEWLENGKTTYAGK
ncbi:thioredoxin family protein, partial [Alistipes sp. OttesenSCG-928-B03]|nr:thioredoxin family protein [Alistipes sp. OttesenSCG-928-B03]